MLCLQGGRVLQPGMPGGWLKDLVQSSVQAYSMTLALALAYLGTGPSLTVCRHQTLAGDWAYDLLF